MAIRTFATAINDTAYTKVGSNVTKFAAVENRVGSVLVVVTGVGDSAPAASEANHVPFDGEFNYSDVAADIWMLSPNGSTTIYGLV